MRLLLCTLLLLSGHVLGQTRPWWQESGIYQIYPRSFKDSDGDGTGDLQGIISRLDYLESLGVKTLWLSPIYPSPGADAGYDISDYLDIDPLFGNLSDFDQLLNAVHDKKMYLVLDYVPNHTSDEHVWFHQSRQRVAPYGDYYVWHEGLPDPTNNTNRLPPNNWLSGFGGAAWDWDEVRQEFFLHQFAKKQPDLNYRNPRVVAEMKDVLRFWLDRGVDGFRMDIVSELFEDIALRDEPKVYPRLDLPDDARETLLHLYTEDQDETYFMVQQFRSVLEEEGYSGRFMMTEAYTTLYNTIRYYGTAEYPGAHFPFNFGLIKNIQADSPPSDIKNYVRDWMSALALNATSNWVIGNHDQRRSANRYGSEKVDIMNALAILLPGTAVTYMGEELGMEDNTDITYEEGQDPGGCNAGPDNYAKFTRDFERSPFQWDNTTNSGFSTGTPWLPVNKNYPGLNAAAQEAASESHLQVYKAMLALKTESNFFRKVDIQTTADDQVLVFLRRNFVTNVLVLCNFKETATQVDLTKLFPNITFGSYKLSIKGVGSPAQIGSSLNATDVRVSSYDLLIYTGR